MSPLNALKTVTITSKGQISLPHQLRKRGFKEGKKIALLAYSDRIELRPMADIAELLSKESMEPSLMSEHALAKEWNTPEEDEAWKNL